MPSERYEAAGDRLSATSDYAAVSELDALTICVPTPLSKTRTPDISFVVSAAEAVQRQLRPGQLVILQSTTYPGTTLEILLPILETGGRKVGRDFFLGYAPERVDPGSNETWTIRTTPKLVAGVTEECRRRTEALYSQIVDTVVPVSSPTVAETAKLHENTFRAVNIALANELALMCNHLGISVWEVDAASSKPFAFLPHYPGPGLGGDCIPVVPHFLAWRLREYGYSARLIDAAHEVNASMPQYVVQKVADALNESDRPIKGSRILLLGVAYKADVDDTRESPSLEVLRQLLLRGGDVSYCDPWVSEFELDEQTHRSVAWTPEAVEAADCIVLLTPHREFLEQPLWNRARLVDTRNVAPPGPHVWTI